MTIYAGMDVSDKTKHLCVVDGEGITVNYGDRIRITVR